MISKLWLIATWNWSNLTRSGWNLSRSTQICSELTNSDQIWSDLVGECKVLHFPNVPMQMCAFGSRQHHQTQRLQEDCKITSYILLHQLKKGTCPQQSGPAVIKFLKLYWDSYSKALRTKSACPHKGSPWDTRRVEGIFFWCLAFGHGVCALQVGNHPHPILQDGGHILGVNSLLVQAVPDYPQMFDEVPVDFQKEMNALVQLQAHGAYCSHTVCKKGPKIAW